MTREELIAYQIKEKAFQDTVLGVAYTKTKRALIAACMADARFEYTGGGERAARKAREIADAAEKKFRELLEKFI
jgi:hypothetical protein